MKYGTKFLLLITVLNCNNISADWAQKIFSGALSAATTAYSQAWRLGVYSLTGGALGTCIGGGLGYMTGTFIAQEKRTGGEDTRGLAIAILTGAGIFVGASAGATVGYKLAIERIAVAAAQAGIRAAQAAR